MKRILLMVASLTVWLIVSAAPVTSKRAQQIAETFFRTAGRTLSTQMKTHELLPQTRNTGSPDFYVYAPQDEQGFVIVSGDDLLPAIVGYSLDASAGAESVPPQLKAWLEAYSRYVKDVQQGKAQPYTERDTQKGEAIAPLLTTAWDQGYPYNNLCPGYDDIHYPTGCVATAMAQIMKYHNWPRQGEGTVEHWSGGQINLSDHTYDWENMINSYPVTWNPDGTVSPDGFTEKQATEIATLMRDCGCALNMIYQENGSSAYSNDITGALFNHFKYAPTLKFRTREHYTTETWTRLIREELLAGRPLEYSGATPQNEGHSFVCDGIDENNLLHINWGWSGSYNGYFDMDILQPEGGGTGSGTGGYFYREAITTGIRPITPEDEGMPDTRLTTTGVRFAIYKHSSEIPYMSTYIDQLINYSMITHEIDPHIAWLNSNGEMTQFSDITYNNTFASLRPNRLLNELSGNISFPPSIYNTPGKHSFLLVNKIGNEVERFDMGEMPCGGVLVVAADGSMTIEDPVYSTDIRIISVTSIGKAYVNTPTPLSVHFHNAGQATYNERVYLALIPEHEDSETLDDYSNYVKSTYNGFWGCIPMLYGMSDNTCVINTWSLQEPGRYRVRFCVQNNDRKYLPLPENTTYYLEVAPLPENPILTLTEPIQWYGGDELVQSTDIYFSLTASIKAIGKQRYNGEVWVCALRDGNDSSQEAVLFRYDCSYSHNSTNILDINEQTNMLSVLPEGNYRLYLKQYTPTGMAPIEGDNTIHFRLLPAIETYPCLSGPVIINSGQEVKAYSTVDVTLPLSSNGDFKGYIRIYDSHFSGKWNDDLVSEYIPVSLQKGTTKEYTIRCQALESNIKITYNRALTVYYYNEQYEQVGELALHPNLLYSYNYQLVPGTDYRLKLAAPAEFSNGTDIDPGSSGELKVNVCSIEPQYVNGELFLYSSALSNDGKQINALQASPVALSIPAYNSKEVTFNYSCVPNVATGYYNAALYCKIQGTDYVVSPDDLNYSLHFFVMSGTGINVAETSPLRLTTSGKTFQLEGLTKKNKVSIHTSDGRTVYINRKVETPTLRIPLLHAGSGLFLITVESESGVPVVLKGILK